MLLVRVDASPIHLGEVGLDVDHDQAPEGPTRGPLVPRQEQPGLQDWSQHRPPFGRVASPRLQESAQCSRHERKREIRVEPRKQGTAGPARLVSQIATSVHLAVAGAPAAVTAGAETPLFVNAGPAGPSPANFESTSPVEIDQRPELRGRRVSGAARRVSASTTAARCSRSAHSGSEACSGSRPASRICRSPGSPSPCRCRLPCIRENAVLRDDGRDVRRAEAAESLAGGEKQVPPYVRPKTRIASGTCICWLLGGRRSMAPLRARRTDR